MKSMTFKFLSVLALSIGGFVLAAPADAETYDGKWAGKLVPSAEADCRNDGFMVKGFVRGNDLTLRFRTRRGITELEGKIDRDGNIKAYGVIGGREFRFTLDGSFNGDQLEGVWYIEDGKCAGNIEVSRGGGDARADHRPPPPGEGIHRGDMKDGRAAARRKFEEQRQATEKAEQESKAMQAQIERLKAEQAALKKKAELAELQSKQMNKPGTRSLAPAPARPSGRGSCPGRCRPSGPAARCRLRGRPPAACREGDRRRVRGH